MALHPTEIVEDIRGSWLTYQRRHAPGMPTKWLRHVNKWIHASPITIRQRHNLAVAFEADAKAMGQALADMTPTERSEFHEQAGLRAIAGMTVAQLRASDLVSEAGLDELSTLPGVHRALIEGARVHQELARSGEVEVQGADTDALAAYVQAVVSGAVSALLDGLVGRGWLTGEQIAMLEAEVVDPEENGE